MDSSQYNNFIHQNLLRIYTNLTQNAYITLHMLSCGSPFISKFITGEKYVVRIGK